MSNKREDLEKDPLLECFRCEREIRVKDAAMAVMGSLEMLGNSSQNVANAKAALTPELWNGLVNTVTMTLLSAIGTLGMTEGEALEFASRVAKGNPHIKSVHIAIMSEDDGDVPKA